MIRVLALTLVLVAAVTSAAVAQNRARVLITVVKSNGEKRTYNLVDSFPQSFNFVDLAAEGNSGATMHWVLEVRVQRIEMA